MTSMVNGLGGSAGFGEGTLAANDDGSTSLISISSIFPNGFNYFGNVYTGVYVNNNGNVTFNSTLSAFTPFGISNASIPILAPFFADVDTRGGATSAGSSGTSTGSNLVYYDVDTTNGIFTATWDDVGYFNRKTNKSNAFQLQIIHTGDSDSVDFDVKFIYENIDWTTGDFSGGSNGLGGTVARAGLSGGNGLYRELTASGVQQDILDLDTSPGSITFHFRNGSTGADAIDGTTGIDVIYGDDGNDTIDGDDGEDMLFGGDGDDTYVVGTGDYVQENSGEGSDTIESSDTHTLETNIENLNLLGTSDIDGTGNASNNYLRGNDGANHLYGLDGNDTLNGRGGNDTLEGGIGNDTYLIQDAGDVVIELTGSGTDLVKSKLTYTLTGYVENLTLMQNGNVDGTGNELDNILTGNSGNNTLSGLLGDDTLSGADGTDDLYGGDGNDLYIITSLLDTVHELTGEGTDLVKASLTYSLGDNVENLALQGSDDMDGTGNGLANALKGNSGVNTLTGLGGDDSLAGYGGNDVLDGGTGSDRMYGGLGNDTYYVDASGDRTTEGTSSGTDLVYSSVGRTLNSNIENLTLTGAANINGVGNSLDNVLTGNTGNNRLTGGDGADIFVFLVDNGADTVADFNAGSGDRIQLSVDASAVTISQSGLNTVIDLGGGDTVTLLNTTATDATFLSHIDYFTIG